MESVVLFDTSVGSQNLGDQIIMRSAEKELSNILRGRYVTRLPTHTPVVTFYQNTNLCGWVEYYSHAKYKFVCGTNLFAKRLSMPMPFININPFNCLPYKGCILLGVGTDPGTKPMDLYTKRLYKKILSTEFIHSARDERTRTLIESLGFRAINTGCPTMWRFNSEFCSQIPSQKAESVIFTVTDYGRDEVNDKKMIDCIKRNYCHVYAWIQGVYDEEYLESLGALDGVECVGPSLASYEKTLCEHDIDYVGTRLHAGMFALQHKRRAIVIAIDNRARDMSETYGFTCIERDAIEDLESLIYSDSPMEININSNAIETWLSQFEKGPICL